MIQTPAFAFFWLTMAVSTLISSSSLSAEESKSITARLAKLGIQECTSVKAFTINIGELHPPYSKTGVMDGKLNPNRSPEAGIELSPEQVGRFIEATTGINVANAGARCFYPHHAIVFLGNNGKILGHYTICFICKRHSHSIGSFSRGPDFRQLEKLVRDLALPTH